jgi:hypothetical protein
VFFLIKFGLARYNQRSLFAIKARW